MNREVPQEVKNPAIVDSISRLHKHITCTITISTNIQIMSFPNGILFLQQIKPKNFIATVTNTRQLIIKYQLKLQNSSPLANGI
jgi:hypothetical protein